LNLLGGHGLGATMMNRCDHLLEGVPGVHICNEKMEVKSRKSCVARSNNPITMVKDFPRTDEMKCYTRVHSTFNQPLDAISLWPML
jgi:hypothetical protein